MIRPRLHLSTMILLTVMAGVFVGVNVVPRMVVIDTFVLPFQVRGWPYEIQRFRDWQGERSYFHSAEEIDSGSDGDFERNALTLNCVVAVAILAAVGGATEFMARRWTMKGRMR